MEYGGSKHKRSDTYRAPIASPNDNSLLVNYSFLPERHISGLCLIYQHSVEPTVDITCTDLVSRVSTTTNTFYKQ